MNEFENKTDEFDYDSAFSINSGLLSSDEQQKLRNARVAIVGVGGAGGVIAITLARSGVANFTLVDHKNYNIDDMHRDIGCFTNTLGNNKAEVIRKEILRINPAASVETYTDAVSLEGLDNLIQESDVYFAQADDLAFSSRSLVIAQQKKRFAISFMPSGITGYILAIPPQLPYIVGPTDLFGGPKGLSNEELKDFLTNRQCRGGRRWHISQGKTRIEWFRKWCAGETTLTQLCPAVWVGASLACMEAIKYLTGRWQTVKAPRMWHLVTAENKIKNERFRRRSWLFGKFIYWTFGIKWLGIGRRYQKYTTRRLMRELTEMQKQETEGKEVKAPFMWRHLI